MRLLVDLVFAATFGALVFLWIILIADYAGDRLDEAVAACSPSDRFLETYQ